VPKSDEAKVTNRFHFLGDFLRTLWSFFPLLLIAAELRFGNTSSGIPMEFGLCMCFVAGLVKAQAAARVGRPGITPLKESAVRIPPAAIAKEMHDMY